MTPGRRKCPICGSKHWHKEPSSGLIACSEGHILQNYRNETTEVHELGPHAVRKRNMKTTKEKKERQSRADPKLYHGARGRYHYFLCLQLVLRKQIVALRRLWDLPDEFEILCKDLWTLHLSMLPDPVPEEAYQDLEPQLEDKEGGTKASAEDADEHSPKGEDEEASSSEEEEKEEEVDPELEALMRENSDFSSSSSSDEKQSAIPSTKKRGKAKRKKGRSSYDRPVSTLAVLVVACWMIRVPAMYRDFTWLIESYELPYLDPLRSLPTDMMQHLTKHNIQALSPAHAPSTLVMHSVASRLAKRLYLEYGVRVPEANGASILWRLTKEMGCTPMLYVMAKRLASVRSVPLTLCGAIAPGLPKIKASDAMRHVSDNAPVEVQCMATLIIVLKMVYGLDGKARVPKDEGDVANGIPPKTEFMRAVKELNDLDDKRHRIRFSPRNMAHVGDMSEKEMDEYIEFCRRTLVGGHVREGILEGYFPLGEGGEALKEEMSRMTRGMESGVEPEEVKLFAGNEYKTWNEVRNGEYRTVLDRGSELAGVTVEYLNWMVGQMVT